MNSVSVRFATSPADYEAGKVIFQAYAKFLGLDLEFQGFSKELAELPLMYGPPKGFLLLAGYGENTVGAVGLREFEPGIAEMKRMFVQENQQGRGVGKALMRAFMAKVPELGYSSVRLDTIPALDRAIAMYRSFGFEEIPPYRYNPHPDAIFMEYRIT